MAGHTPFSPRNLWSRAGWRRRYDSLHIIRRIFGDWPLIVRRKRHARYRRGREGVRPRHRRTR